MGFTARPQWPLPEPTLAPPCERHLYWPPYTGALLRQLGDLHLLEIPRFANQPHDRRAMNGMERDPRRACLPLHLQPSIATVDRTVASTKP